jgi:hypothetical protein
MPQNGKTIEFSVLDVPPTINRLLRMHWTKRVAAKKVWTEELEAALHFGKPPAISILRAWSECEDRVRIEVHVIHRKEFDQDNLASVCKIPLDALKTLGCIIDDGQKFIELPTPTQEIGKPETRFRITRLER